MNTKNMVVMLAAVGFLALSPVVVAQSVEIRQLSEHDARAFTYGARVGEFYLVDAGQDFYSDTVLQQFIGMTVTPRPDSRTTLYFEYWRSDGNTSAVDTFAREDDFMFEATTTWNDRFRTTSGFLLVLVNRNSADLVGVLQPRFKASVGVGSWTLTGAVKYNFTNSGYAHEGGWFFEAGAGRAFNLGHRISFVTDTLIVRDANGAFGFNPTTTVLNTPGFTWNATTGVQVYALYKWAKNLGTQTDGRKDSYGCPQVGVVWNF